MQASVSQLIRLIKFAIFSFAAIGHPSWRRGGGRRDRGGGAGRGVYQLPRTDAGKGCYTDLQRQAEERQRQRRSRREGGSQQQRTTWTWGGDDELGSSEVSGKAVRITTHSSVIKATTCNT